MELTLMQQERLFKTNVHKLPQVSMQDMPKVNNLVNQDLTKMVDRLQHVK
jgi:hypothetical protein